MSPKTTNQDHDVVQNLDEIVAKSGFENIQIAPMSPNPNHESKDQEQKENNHAKARMQEKLIRKISEPSIESGTYFSHGDNCATNTCLDTKNAESEASSPGENLELASVIPNPTNQDHDAVESLGKIAPDCEAKNLTIKISEPSIESETAYDNGDNCPTNTCPEIVQEVSEKTVSEGKSDIEKKNPVSDQTK